MLPQSRPVAAASTATSAARFARTLCAAVALLLPHGTLRAGGEFPAPGGPSPSDNETAVLAVGVVRPTARVETTASILLLQASSSNPVYATVTNPFPLLSPHWNNRTVSPDFNPAFYVGARRLFDGGVDVRAGWTHLNSYDGGSTMSADPLPPAPAGMPPASGRPTNQGLGPPYLVGPPLPFAVADAVSHFAYDAVDLDAGLTLGAGGCAQARPFAGLQFARVSRSLATDFRSVGDIFSFRDVSRSLFEGAGPRVGVDLRYASGSLDFLGGIAGATLIGRRHSSIDFLTVSPQGTANGLPVNTQSLTSPHTTQVVPEIDARIGAGYTLPVGRFGLLRCEAGYQAAVYVSAVNQYNLTEVEDQLTTQNNAGTEATFLRTAGETQSNFLVHGPYLKLFLQF